MAAWKGKFGNLEYREEMLGVEGLEGRLLQQGDFGVTYLHITFCASF